MRGARGGRRRRVFSMEYRPRAVPGARRATRRGPPGSSGSLAVPRPSSTSAIGRTSCLALSNAPLGEVDGYAEPLVDESIAYARAADERWCWHALWSSALSVSHRATSRTPKRADGGSRRSGGLRPVNGVWVLHGVSLLPRGSSRAAGSGQLDAREPSRACAPPLGAMARGQLAEGSTPSAPREAGSDARRDLHVADASRSLPRREPRVSAGHVERRKARLDQAEDHAHDALTIARSMAAQGGGRRHARGARRVRGRSRQPRRGRTPARRRPRRSGRRDRLRFRAPPSRDSDAADARRCGRRLGRPRSTAAWSEGAHALVGRRVRLHGAAGEASANGPRPGGRRSRRPRRRSSRSSPRGSRIPRSASSCSSPATPSTPTCATSTPSSASPPGPSSPRGWPSGWRRRVMFSMRGFPDHGA